MRRLFVSLMMVPMMAGIASADYVDSGSGFAIPDNDAGGMSSVINVPVNETITDVSVTLNGFSHTWVGDMIVTLSGPGGSMELMWRTGSTTGTGGGDSSNVNGTYGFSDTGGDWWAEAASGDNNYTMAPGTYRPTTATGTLENFGLTFAGTNTQGNWTLFISDNSSGDTGSIAGWTLSITSFFVPEPSTAGLAGLACLGLAFYRRRK